MEFFQCALQIGRPSSIIDMRMTRGDHAPATEIVERALLGRVGALANAVVEDVDDGGTGSVWRGKGDWFSKTQRDQMLDGSGSI